MHTRSFIALVALAALSLAGTSALASEITIVQDTFTSTKTRAEVHAEVLKARSAGVLHFSTETQSHVQAPTKAAPANASTLTREQVRAQLLNGPRAQVAEVNFGA